MFKLGLKSFQKLRAPARLHIFSLPAVKNIGQIHHQIGEFAMAKSRQKKKLKARVKKPNSRMLAPSPLPSHVAGQDAICKDLSLKARQPLSLFYRVVKSQLDLEVNVNGEKIDDTHFELVLTIKATAKVEEKSCLISSLICRHFCALKISSRKSECL